MTLAIQTFSGRVRGAAVLLGICAVLAGCGALPDKPSRVVMYDFGPGDTAPAPAAAPSLPTIALTELETNPRLDGTQILYRLGYADANELRPYGQARWSMAPTQMVRQRIRNGLSQRRLVLNAEENASMTSTEGKAPDTLRVTVEEFSQVFDTPSSSVGLVRLRATLVTGAPGGDRVRGQKTFTVQRPAATADAAGGVKALAAATDAAVNDIVQWVDGLK
ncbi:ABC-type transport auxiliary lipoprotein family protein [Variovorax rhizosphaerae]|uniref:ABC-type transport auxiliary lipoprotein family protein n=1 Tax=Variovorax rhizosphaerae TaxID=1836200 RepID=A0ABU8WFK8_9BURK